MYLACRVSWPDGGATIRVVFADHANPVVFADHANPALRASLGQEPA
jgi:hypothetical protein